MKCLTNKWREGAMLLSFLLISCLAGFFVKFGGKFFSAHLANSVSAYIFL